jgi:pyrimidine deaminase RibD-like protein
MARRTRLSDRALMRKAIALARRCESEPGRVSPKVGAVIARNGVVIGEAFRGELRPAHGRLLSVAHTEDDEKIRIINARSATRAEAKQYDEP